MDEIVTLKYIPSDTDRALCAGMDWHCTPEQRAIIRRHVDAIVPPLPELTPEQETALDWIRAQDDARNTAPFEETRYVFDAHEHTGALGWLVDMIQYRSARWWQIETAMLLWEEAGRPGAGERDGRD